MHTPYILRLNKPVRRRIRGRKRFANYISVVAVMSNSVRVEWRWFEMSRRAPIWNKVRGKPGSLQFTYVDERAVPEEIRDAVYAFWATEQDAAGKAGVA